MRTLVSLMAGAVLALTLIPTVAHALYCEQVAALTVPGESGKVTVQKCTVGNATQMSFKLAIDGCDGILLVQKVQSGPGTLAAAQILCRGARIGYVLGDRSVRLVQAEKIDASQDAADRDMDVPPYTAYKATFLGNFQGISSTK